MGKAFSNADAGGTMHVLIGKVIKSLLPGCTCTTRGPVMVLQIRLFCLCFPADVLGWVPCLSTSLLLVLPRDAEEHGAGWSCSCARAEEAPRASERMVMPLQE